MSPPKKKPASIKNELRGNYVSEWFGHRVYPVVAKSPKALADQEADRCPFLTAATGESKDCIKSQASRGICNISSASNGRRQDWLICPYRALDKQLLEQISRRLYGVRSESPLLVAPAPTLARAKDRKRVVDEIRAGHTAIVYLQNNLGGEISVSPTERSPELAFDITLVQIVERDGEMTLGKYGIFEVQTMDFHGKYRFVVDNLKHALRLHRKGFHNAVAEHPEWLSEHIEGPNIANVFKRTFYQMLLKFQIGADETCVGCALALPASVWDSWQRHLGRPELAELSDGTFDFRSPGATGRTPAWIYVFDTETHSPTTPRPIWITKIIATDASALTHAAFKVVPEVIAAGAGSADRILATIRRRVATWWPELGRTD